MQHDTASRFVKMRPVDLFADLMGVDEKTKERAERGYKGVRVIYTAARIGRAAASKANVILAWIDAGNALLDAIASYAVYRQAKEVTRQLEAEGEVLRNGLTQMRKQWQIANNVAEEERNKRAAAIDRDLDVQRAALHIDQQHYDDCKDQAKRVGAVLNRLRQQSAPNCPRLAALEKAYYRLVHEQIQAAIALIDS